MKVLKKTLKIVFIGYVLICLLLYLFQEKLIFFPATLPKNYSFKFDQRFEEINIKTTDQKTLNGVLFKTDSSKGVIFYLHGNAGSLESWGAVAKTYTALHYDVFMLDYRGYGKSEGAISSQQQVFDDVQLAYSEIKKRYAEDKIIVLGYSIGTGLASKLASGNHPRLLILQAPYYSLTDMMSHTYPIIPAFILKYKFRTNEQLKLCKMPIVIFHGDEDEVIDYSASVKLKETLKTGDTMILLKGQGHNGMTENPDYQKEIVRILQ